MTEKDVSREHKQPAVSEHARQMLDTIERGDEIQAEQIASREALEDLFGYLCVAHMELDSLAEDEGALVAPVTTEHLAGMLREIKDRCNALENAGRALYLTSAIAGLARMDFLSAQPGEAGRVEDVLVDYRAPDDFPGERRMPEAYYETVRLLGAETYRSGVCSADSYGSGALATNHAVMKLGNSNYGMSLQRAILEMAKSFDPSPEALFSLHIAASNKARFRYDLLPGKAYEDAADAMEAIDNPTQEAEHGFKEARLGNYIRGTHDVLGSALALRELVPDMTADDCVRALYANAANIGALTRRLTSANPLDHNRVTAREDHDAARLGEVVKGAAYEAEWNNGVPMLSIPQGVPHENEFPEECFSEDDEVRKRQEERLVRQRNNGGRCPVHNPVLLPDGDIKKRIEEFDAEIKERYRVDPQIFLGDYLNPAALTVARIIQAGERTGLWATT